MLHTAEINEAFAQDLHKSANEAYLTEINPTLVELRYLLKNLRRLVKPQYVPPNFMTSHGSCTIEPRPLGPSLVISPFNYPF